MKNFALNSIPKENCLYTEESILSLIKICGKCRKIPLPAYKIFRMSDKVFCWECALSQNVERKMIIMQTEKEIEILNNLVINCENKDCDRLFGVKNLEDFVSHVEKCGKNSEIAEKNLETGLNNLLKRKRIKKTNKLDKLRKEMDNKLKESITQLMKLNANFMKKIQQLEEKINNQNLKNDSLEEKVKSLQDKLMQQEQKLLTSPMHTTLSESLAMEKPNFKSNNCITLHSHTKDVFSVIQLSTRHIASSSNDGTIKVWDLNTNQIVHTYLHNGTYIYKLKDGRLVSFLSCFNKYEIEIIDLNLQENNIQKLVGHLGLVFCVTQLNDGKLASGGQDSVIRFWDLLSGKTEVSLQNDHGSVTAITQLNDGRLVSGGVDSILKIWDYPKIENPVLPPKLLKGHKGGINCVIELNKGIIASAGSDKLIKIWNVDQLVCTHNLTGHRDGVICIVRIDDGKFASCSDMTIKVWNTEFFMCVGTFKAHDDKITSLTALSDGRIASCSYDRSIKIWK